MKNVLVIGGGGYIGSVLTEELLKADIASGFTTVFFRKQIFKDLQQAGNLDLYKAIRGKQSHRCSKAWRQSLIGGYFQ